eukprot:Sspe_Gene.83899::Locus_55048_Transcript_1_1_Confidence_1.000_Length_2406::g.83899::m.83899/K11381/bkdA; 2-oxoisovalerate dehydrogenase E1 component
MHTALRGAVGGCESRGVQLVAKRSIGASPWGWGYAKAGLGPRGTPAPSRDEWYGKDAGSRQATVAMLGEAIDLPQLRSDAASEINKMMEIKQAKIFQDNLENGLCHVPKDFNMLSLESSGMSEEDVLQVLQAAFATALVHVESRVASSLGLGFYTIGPGGEELVASIGRILRPTDAMALHYRHTAAQIARQIKSGKSLDDILLDRARGHVVSALDPVTGANHCAIGGGKYDFLVTSTLASQAPQAVGRALGNSLAHQLKLGSLLPSDAINFVSVGDGSVNHAQYLAAVNLAEYASHRKFRCPVVFCVSDNGISISLKGYGWLEKEYVKKLRMPVFKADGRNMFEVWKMTKDATEYARGRGKPAFLLFSNLPRRFGHAATDRQGAYLTPAEIEGVANINPLVYASAQAVECGVTTWDHLAKMWSETWDSTRKAFDIAVNEPKLTSREEVLRVTSQPLSVPEKPPTTLLRSPPMLSAQNAALKDRHVMRKHMTRVLSEALEAEKNLIYMGEDVEHGGYYLVTDQLVKKFPNRVRDFPPEETCLIGAGIAYAQLGLLPIVEIPYAKYLDCGIDQYFEAAIFNWLSSGKQPNGMIFRLQGFDRGVFGGNFHTHNILHIPPGVDVVCYSNGPDYARGMRNAIKQAKAGRVVMTVDCTNLLNLRHTSGTNGAWQMPYTDTDDVATYDEVTVYGDGPLAIVTYGNGVVTSLQAAEVLRSNGLEVTIIDTPYLSDVPAGLVEALSRCERVVFADICKMGQHPLGGTISKLQQAGVLQRLKWQICAAQPTYNPLG